MNFPSQNRLWKSRPYTRLFGVGDHWYRSGWDGYAPTPDTSGRCNIDGCGRPRTDHWLESGEWTLPRRNRWRRILYRTEQRIKGGRR